MQHFSRLAGLQCSALPRQLFNADLEELTLNLEYIFSLHLYIVIVLLDENNLIHYSLLTSFLHGKNLSNVTEKCGQNLPRFV